MFQLTSPKPSYTMPATPLQNNIWSPEQLQSAIGRKGIAIPYLLREPAERNQRGCPPLREPSVRDLPANRASGLRCPHRTSPLSTVSQKGTFEGSNLTLVLARNLTYVKCRKREGLIKRGGENGTIARQATKKISTGSTVSKGFHVGHKRKIW